MLPKLEYRRLGGDMIQVFKIVHDSCHLEAAVKLNFNTFSTTRGNKYNLQKSSYHYNRRKYSFSTRVINNSVCGVVCQVTWLRLILLTLLRIVLINTGLIKIFKI